MASLSEKQVKAEIRHSLQEWGIDLDGSNGGRGRNAAHRQFYLNVMNKTVEFSNPDISDVPSALLILSSASAVASERGGKILPKDPCNALEVFLTYELEEIMKRPYRDYVDCLGISYSYLPPYRGVGLLQDGTTFRRYTKRDDFEKFTKNQLDPLKRFVFDDLYFSPSEKYFNNYMVEKAPLVGAIAEVLVVRHAIHNRVPCFCCKRRGSLQWNGGSSSESTSSTVTSMTSWRDMICTACGSSYEIKSKASAEHVLKALSKGMPTGSYRSYNLIRLAREYNKNGKKQQHIDHNSTRTGSSETSSRSLIQIPREECKHFLVIVSRGYTYPVKIAEIEKVVPRLSPLSFRYRGPSSSATTKSRMFSSSKNCHNTTNHGGAHDDEEDPSSNDDSSTHRLSLKSYATVRQSSITSWFRLDEFADLSRSDIEEVVRKVFVSKFSIEEWNQLHGTYFDTKGQYQTKDISVPSAVLSNAVNELVAGTKTEEATQSKIAGETADDGLEAIRESLEGLKTREDDWETAFDSD